MARKARDHQLLGGIAWSAAARTASQLLTWCITLVVARLLTPADYGVVAGATAYLGMVGILTEFGLATAIVSQRGLSASAISQLGGLSLALGVAGWVATTAAAPILSRALGIDELSRVLPVLGVATAFGALNALPFALLQKELRFRELANIELMRIGVSSCMLLVLAWWGAGYWALVLNEVAAVVVIALLLWMKVRYRLAIPRLAEIRSSLRISRDVLLARGAWYTYSNADFAIVGRTLGKQDLGDYSMAWTLTSMPSQKIAGIIMNVTTGIFASVQHDVEELRRYFLRISQSLALVLWPATIGIALVAPELVRAVLGQRWTGAVPIIQALAFATALRSIGPLCSQVLLARLKSALELRYTALSAVVLPIGFLVGARFGAMGVALSWSVLSLPLVALQLMMTCREIELSLWTFASGLVGPFLATGIMATCVSLVRPVIMNYTDSNGLCLALLIAIGVVSYGAVSLSIMPDTILGVVRLLRGRDRQAE